MDMLHKGRLPVLAVLLGFSLMMTTFCPGQSQWTTSGNNIYNSNTGNVGIGISAPAATLDVISTTFPQARFGYDALNNLALTTTSSGGTTFTFDGTSPFAIFKPQSNSTSAFTFANASSNGILTVDTVNGGVGINGAVGGSYFTVNAGVTGRKLGTLLFNRDGDGLSTFGTYSLDNPDTAVENAVASLNQVRTQHASGTIRTAIGTYGAVNWDRAGSIASAAGVVGVVQSNSINGTGVVTTGYALFGSAATNSASAIFNPNSVTGGGTDITNYIGLYIGNASARTDPAPSTGSYGIYAAGGNNYFGGNIGIGTTAPSQRLEVSGSIKLSAGSAGTIVFSDGTTQSTAWTGAVCGGDYAESVQVAGGRSQYDPGDVLVIDPAVPGGFKKSSEVYSAMVAGIYSTKPGLIGRRYTSPDKAGVEVPMALVGIVPTKVSAENGPIKAGDLLVTSSTSGYAMKGTDRNQMLGAIVGKALGSLDSGTGVIEVLVSLQ